MVDDEIAGIRRALLDEGYAIVPSVLSPAQLRALRAACDRVLAAASRDHLATHRTTGSMMHVERDEWFADLIALPRTLAILRGLGFGKVAWSAGYVINKPAGGPRLFWHQDWLWWQHPVSTEAVPHQLFAMYYATDTDRGNGCLRVVPGSHRRRLPAHDALTTAHSGTALAGSDASDPMFGDIAGEVDVPIRAGDLLLGDSRLLHAAHANASATARPLVTLWYQPAYDRLPAAIQACYAATNADRLAHWPAQVRNRVDVALPYLSEAAEPLAICRDPHPVAG